MPVFHASEADLRLYSSIAGCPLRCVGIKNAPEEGYSPCGFFASPEREQVVFLVVGPDPGPQLPGNPVGGTAEDRAREFLENPRFLSGEKRRTLFHEGVLAALKDVLLESNDRAVFRRAAYSNVVKCSPLGKVAPPETQKTCYATHLSREIEHFHPLAIIAVGTSKDFFSAHPPVRTTGEKIPWFSLVHPNYSRFRPAIYGRVRAEQIEAIKRWYQGECGKPPAAPAREVHSSPRSATAEGQIGPAIRPPLSVTPQAETNSAASSSRSQGPFARAHPQIMPEESPRAFPFPLDKLKLEMALRAAASFEAGRDFFCPTSPVRNWLKDTDEKTLVRAVTVRGAVGYGPLQEQLKAHNRAHYNNTKAAYANVVALAIWELSRRATQRGHPKSVTCVIPTFGEIGAVAASCGFQPPQATWSTEEIVRQFANGATSYCRTTCKRGFAVHGEVARHELQPGEEVGITEWLRNSYRLG